MGEFKAENEQPLYIEVWKEASEKLRHHDNLYWHTVRHYTGLISLLAGGAGAALSIAVLPITARLFVSASLLLLGGIFAFVAWYIMQKLGLYVGYFQKLHNDTELIVVNSLNLDVTIKEAWIKNRQLEGLEKDSEKKGSVRVVVPWSFFGIGIILISVIFFIVVVIAFQTPKVPVSNSAKVHRSDAKVETLENDSKEVRANKAN